GRRRPVPATTASARRVAFTVIDPLARQAAVGREGKEIEVDSIDLAKPRSHRPLAAGRSPTAEAGRHEWGVPTEALIEPSRRDRLRGGFPPNALEAPHLPS